MVTLTTGKRGQPNRSQTILSPCGSDTSSRPLLTGQEEIELGRRIQANGCVQSRNTLVEMNLGLVKSIANKVARIMHAPFDDLVAEGSIALIRAADRYDPDRGIRFAAYASPWIRHAMQDVCCEIGRPLRVPAKVIRELRTLTRTTEELSSELDRTPTAKELATHTGMSVARIRDLRERLHLVARSSGHLEGELSSETNPSHTPTKSEDPGSEDDIFRLRLLVRDLPIQEREAVSMCFGLNREPPMSETQAALKLNISTAGVARLLERGRARLRMKLHRLSVQARAMWPQ